MREYNYKDYISLVENIDDEIFQEFMNMENELITNIKNSKNKTFIDLGAGYGRLTPILKKIAGNIISIEINPEMLLELKRRNSRLNNAKTIEGDVSELSFLLKNQDVKKPVLLMVQNTIGVIEGGRNKKVLEEMKKIAKENNGEIIISFCRNEALRTWGIKVYNSIKKMSGEIDMDKTNFNTGIFVSKTGYISKWRNKKEIEEIKKFFEGKILHEIWTDNFCILHIEFN